MAELDVSVRIQLRIPLFVTAITVGELTFGAHKSARVAQNLAQVDILLNGVTILPFNFNISILKLPAATPS
jgi:predicted nucleic acid-binding protein